MEALFDSWAATGRAARLLRLPFANAFVPFDAATLEEEGAAERLLGAYQGMMAACWPDDDAVGDGPGHAANEPQRQAGPYNLLVTRRWMLLVPRSRESFGSISVNALGFAGSLFVRDDAEMRTLRAAGPMRALREVARPA
jgi:ATP adenylyltransferase